MAFVSDVPWIGHGVGSADDLINRVYSTAVGHPHNDYLRLLHDYGLLGTCLWGIGYALLLMRTWRAWHVSTVTKREGRTHDSSSELRIHAAAFLALVGVAIAMITDNAIVYMYVIGPLGVLVGLSLGLSGRSIDMRAARLATPIQRVTPTADRPRGRSERISLTPTPPRPTLTLGNRPPPICLRPTKQFRLSFSSEAHGQHAHWRGLGQFRRGDCKCGPGIRVHGSHRPSLAPAGVGVFFQVVGIFSILIVVTQFGSSATVVKTISEYGRLVAPVISGAASQSRSFQPPHYHYGCGLCLLPRPDTCGGTCEARESTRRDRLLAGGRSVHSLCGAVRHIARSDASIGDHVAHCLPRQHCQAGSAPPRSGRRVSRDSGAGCNRSSLGRAARPYLRRCRICGCSTSAITVGRTRGPKLRPRPFTILVREFYGLTAPQWLADAFQLAILWIDVLLVGALVSSRQAGVYGAVSRLVMIGTLGLAALVFRRPAAEWSACSR